uniref:Uncharacterized protein n=1 Tax=viral metagenome TaxID=1070528 RepID=A0A6M3KVV1_9ZZZZ
MNLTKKELVFIIQNQEAEIDRLTNIIRCYNQSLTIIDNMWADKVKIVREFVSPN